MPPQLLAPLLLLPVVVGAIFICVPQLIAKLGGWTDLAKTYRAPAEPSGIRLRFQSVRLGRSSYNNCMHFCLSGEGLYMAPMWPLSYSHPALLIPWPKLKLVMVRKVFLARWAVLCVG